MIHIACADISQVNTDLYQQLYRVASSPRKARADRYRRFEDSVRCVAADALLRFALKDHFGAGVAYSVGHSPLGKPYLENRPDFHFSLSHSGKWVVIAYGGSEVGIDVETIDAKGAKENIARRYFTPEEQKYLFSRVTEADRAIAFFEIWTAKESYLKYLGTGLTKNLSSFCVLAPEDLRVHLHRERLEDACLCLCTTAQNYQIRLLTAAQL